MNSVRCVWSINEKSVLAVYKLYVAAASSTIFVGHSLGKVSVYRFHAGSARELGCRRKADADDPVTIPTAARSSQVSASPFFVSDLGSAISDEGIFECHSSSANIVRNPTFCAKKPDFLIIGMQRCLVAFSDGQRFFTSAFDDSLDRSIKCFSLQNEHPLHVANMKVTGVLLLHRALDPSESKLAVVPAPLCFIYNFLFITGNACQSLAAYK
jgi:hypothetical protein